MLARNETIFKWTVYSLAALLCLLVQGFVLESITLWGVIPFVYPLLAAIPSTYEDPVPATVFSLCMGVVCDLLLPEALPCFYTLLFPAIGLLSSLMAKSILPAGFLCSFAAGAAAFLMNGLFHCFILALNRTAHAWSTGMFLALREFCISVLLIFPMTALFRRVHRRTHWND